MAITRGFVSAKIKPWRKVYSCFWSNSPTLPECIRMPTLCLLYVLFFPCQFYTVKFWNFLIWTHYNILNSSSHTWCLQTNHTGNCGFALAELWWVWGKAKMKRGLWEEKWKKPFNLFHFSVKNKRGNFIPDATMYFSQFRIKYFISNFWLCFFTHLTCLNEFLQETVPEKVKKLKRKQENAIFYFYLG